MMKHIRKIAVTGGPCAGKSAAFRYIRSAFEKRGYTVLCIGETATELISGGVAPWTCGTNCEYHVYQLMLQLKKEEIFDSAARGMDAERVLIVCDRGAPDCRAYMTEEEFGRALRALGVTEKELMSRYEAVFHLTSAAKGRFGYTLKNNAARRENREEAARLDDLALSAWAGHPHRTVIGTCEDFGEKMRLLLEKIGAFLEEEQY